MKCRICGANLKKEGDICVNCYKKYQEEEELKKDTNEILKFHGKYSIGFEFAKYSWMFLVLILSILVCISSAGIIETLIVSLGFLAVIGFLFFLDKRLAKARKVVFYEKKVVYTFNFLFINIKKMVKYSDLTDVTYYQTFTQKRFGFGDLCVYAKGTFPGTTLLNGFQIKNVENVKELLETIGQILVSVNEEE